MYVFVWYRVVSRISLTPQSWTRISAADNFQEEGPVALPRVKAPFLGPEGTELQERQFHRSHTRGSRVVPQRKLRVLVVIYRQVGSSPRNSQPGPSRALSVGREWRSSLAGGPGSGAFTRWQSRCLSGCPSVVCRPGQAWRTHGLVTGVAHGRWLQGGGLGTSRHGPVLTTWLPPVSKPSNIQQGRRPRALHTHTPSRTHCPAGHTVRPHSAPQEARAGR